MFFEILQTPGNRSLKRKRRTLELTILRLRFRLQYRPFLDPLTQSAQLLNAQAKEGHGISFACASGFDAIMNHPIGMTAGFPRLQPNQSGLEEQTPHPSPLL